MPTIQTYFDQFIDVEGRSLEFIGKVANDMQLINSNCIIATSISEAQFNFDCASLSITSYEGTSIPTLDTVNNKITFTAGTFYNLILSNNYHFPIAEGLLDKSYKTESENVYINWNSITWGTQESYHYNINNGFYNLNNAKLPFKPVGLNYTNPKVAGHNGAETEVTMQVFREELGDSQFHYSQSDLSSVVNTFNSIVDNTEVFSIRRGNLKINIETFLPGDINFKTKRFKQGFHKTY
tara:strand:+ start:294 stop:1007 length:714 start_codon:yes stop_codon:yes gene_type:complete